MEFEAKIESAPRGGAVVEVPFDVKAEWGKARMPVVAHFDGHEYRGSVARMGGRYIIGVRKDIRTSIRKEIGDTIWVTLVPDTEPREVVLPRDLLEALDSNAEARGAFGKLSYTHRKEYVQWIEGAKKQETRERRIRKTIARLLGN